jgi:hypothetical protein
MTLRTMLKTKLSRRSIFKFCNLQGNLAQQIAHALNKLPDKIAFVNMGDGVTPRPWWRGSYVYKISLNRQQKDGSPKFSNIYKNH